MIDVIGENILYYHVSVLNSHMDTQSGKNLLKDPLRLIRFERGIRSDYKETKTSFS